MPQFVGRKTSRSRSRQSPARSLTNCVSQWVERRGFDSRFFKAHHNRVLRHIYTTQTQPESLIGREIGESKVVLHIDGDRVTLRDLSANTRANGVSARILYFVATSFSETVPISRAFLHARALSRPSLRRHVCCSGADSDEGNQFPG